MNTTPIETLLSRQSGKFLSDDELFKIQNDLSFLIQENKKLSSLLDQQKNTSFQQTISQSQLQPFLESIQNESVQHEQQQQQSQQFQPQVQNQQQQHSQQQHSQPVPEPQFPTQQVSKVITTSSNEVHHDVPSDVKTITIIIDTNKLVYLLLFIIIMIIILKK
jgi:hypothetical protein